MFEKLSASNIKLKLAKCQLLQTEITFCGHTINEHGIKPKKQLIEKVINHKVPETKKELDSFLSLINYFGKYIPMLADVTYELSQLRKIKNISNINSKCNTSYFNKIIRAVKHYVELKHPDFKKKFTLFIDASDVAAGAVLTQYNDSSKQYEPIQFASRKFNDTEITNMTTGDKEFSALVWGIEKFKSYLVYNEFDVYTDHKNLIYILNELNKEENLFKYKYTRWLLKLLSYNFRVLHISGVKNILPDYVSRYANDELENDLPIGDEQYVYNLNKIKTNEDAQKCKEVQTSTSFSTRTKDTKDEKFRRNNMKLKINEKRKTIQSQQHNKNNIFDKKEKKEKKPPSQKYIYFDNQLNEYKVKSNNINIRKYHNSNIKTNHKLYPLNDNNFVINDSDSNMNDDYDNDDIEVTYNRNEPYLTRAKRKAIESTNDDNYETDDAFDRTINEPYNEFNYNQEYDFDVEQNKIDDLLNNFITNNNISNVNHLLNKQYYDPELKNIRLYLTDRIDISDDRIQCLGGWQIHDLKNNKYYINDKNKLIKYIDKKGNHLICIPLALRDYYNNYIHKKCIHAGAESIYQYCKNNIYIYWYGMEKDIKDLCRYCDNCQRIKKTQKKNAGLIQTWYPTKKFQTIVVDLITTLPRTASGNVNILSIQDKYSSMTKYIAIPDGKSNTVALAIYNHWICDYEEPEKMLSDNGNCFISRIMKELCNIFNINKIFSTSYHPETNASVERNNRWIKERLRLIAIDMNLDFERNHCWDIYLPTLYSIYNKNTTRKLKMQPFYILFNMKPKDMIYKALEPANLDRNKPEHQSFIEQFENIQNIINHDIKYNINEYQKREKIYADKKRKEIKYNIGEYVLIKNQKRGINTLNKIRFIGPYLIIGSFNNYNNYILRRQQNNPLTIHVNKLVKYNKKIPNDIIDNNIEQNINIEPIDSNEIIHDDNNNNNINIDSENINHRYQGDAHDDNFDPALDDYMNEENIIRPNIIDDDYNINDDEKELFNEDANAVEHHIRINKRDLIESDLGRIDENIINDINDNISGITPTETYDSDNDKHERDLNQPIDNDIMSVDTKYNKMDMNINQTSTDANPIPMNMNLNPPRTTQPNINLNISNVEPPVPTTIKISDDITTTAKMTSIDNDVTITDKMTSNESDFISDINSNEIINEYKNNIEQNINQNESNQIPPALQQMPNIQIPNIELNEPRTNNIPFIDDSNDLQLPNLGLYKLMKNKIKNFVFKNE